MSINLHTSMDCCEDAVITGLPKERMDMRQLASIQKIKSLQPIENADRIELAEILGWKCVVTKGDFHEGDLCVYFEIDSFLPIEDRYEFLRDSCYRNNKVMGEGLKIQTFKFRGQISQGLVLPLRLFPELEGLSLEENLDVTELLKVRKWEDQEEIAQRMGVSSKGGGLPSFIPRTDEARVQFKPQLMALLIPSESVRDYYASIGRHFSDMELAAMLYRMQMKANEKRKWMRKLLKNVKDSEAKESIKAYLNQKESEMQYFRSDAGQSVYLYLKKDEEFDLYYGENTLETQLPGVYFSDPDEAVAYGKSKGKPFLIRKYPLMDKCAEAEKNPDETGCLPAGDGDKNGEPEAAEFDPWGNLMRWGMWSPLPEEWKVKLAKYPVPYPVPFELGDMVVFQDLPGWIKLGVVEQSAEEMETFFKNSGLWKRAGFTNAAILTVVRDEVSFSFPNGVYVSENELRPCTILRKLEEKDLDRMEGLTGKAREKLLEVRREILDGGRLPISQMYEDKIDYVNRIVKGLC